MSMNGSKNRPKSLSKSKNKYYVSNPTSKQKREELFTGLIVGLALLIFLILTLSFVYLNIHRSIHLRTDEEQRVKLELMTNRTYDLFSRIEGYLRFVSNIPSVRTVLVSEDLDSRKSVEKLFAEIVEMNTVDGSPRFDQLRLLDLNGVEKIRVDLEENSAVIIPQDKLQDKSNRYYFTESISLSENQIYMSPLDLNMENGAVELPRKPMIRFVIPVFDMDGEKLGCFIINYQAQQMFDTIDKLNTDSDNEWLLLNEEGYYLKGLNPDKEFSFMFEEEFGFFSEHSNLWDGVRNSVECKHKGSDGAYYKTNIYPFVSNSTLTVKTNYSLMLMTFIPEEFMHKKDSILLRGVVLGGGILGFALILLGWFLGRSRVKNKYYLESLEESATTDGLTGLLNYRAAIERVKYQINYAERVGHSVSLVYLDLNELKSINDLHGHKAGDKMIVAATESLRTMTRYIDIAARIGGDEFIVIFHGLASVNVKDVVRRIEESYAQKGLEMFKQKISFSWGVAFWEGKTDSVEDFINRADHSMYEMKMEHRRKKGLGPNGR